MERELHSSMKHPKVYSWRDVSVKQKMATAMDDFACLQDCDFRFWYQRYTQKLILKRALFF